VSDFYRHAVVAITPGGVQEIVMRVDQQPSGLGWMPDGTLLVVSMKDRRLLRGTSDGEVGEVADLSDLASWHLNDMVVDQQGRAWIGNFGYDILGGGSPVTANIIRVDPDGTTAVVAEDMKFPNGSVVTPDDDHRCTVCRLDPAAICRCARGARTPASSRADAGLPRAPPGFGECGVLGSSPAWHRRPSR
jgi:sugar lactone lactonase YvrE